MALINRVSPIADLENQRKWPKERKPVTLLHDPTGDFRVGATFDVTEFENTLKYGNWPKNATFRDHKGRIYRIVGFHKMPVEITTDNELFETIEAAFDPKQRFTFTGERLLIARKIEVVGQIPMFQ